MDLSQKFDKEVDLQSNDMQQHSTSEPSHSTLTCISTNSSSIHVENPFESCQILQAVKLMSSDEPKSLLSGNLEFYSCFGTSLEQCSYMIYFRSDW